MALFESYRRGAGRRARGFATALLLALLAWMSYAFMSYGNTRLDRLLQFDDPFFAKQLVTGGGNLTEWITPSVFIALGMFIAGLIALRTWLNRPRFADLLIETEAELKRVRWAPRKETNRATGVVLYFVLWFALIMFVYDLTFTMGIGMLQGQPWHKVGWGNVWTTVVPGFDEEADKSK
jgi:preprotein translocase SecE subunit